MKTVDDFLNGITMYRLLFYYLILLVIAAIAFCLFGWFPFSPQSLIFSVLFVLSVCYITNRVFSHVFEVPANTESVYITAFILSLIITPVRNYHDLPLLFWAAVLAIASKFIIAINKKHVFNPAALGISITAFSGLGSASWWIGTLPMMPLLLPGVLIVRKIRRFDLVFYFFVFALATISILSFLRGTNPLLALKATFAESPILFFSFIMLTEPLTTPPTKMLQSVYGAIVGLLFSPQLSIGGFYTTPELALLAGNVFSYIVSPKLKFLLALREKLQIGEGIEEFIFDRPKKFAFTPGQYMEWTLEHHKTDFRGNRRYFTIASSPTENSVLLGIKYYEKGSSFKKAMQSLVSQSKILAGQLTGDFILPKNSSEKLVFIAGGIGITPFRSMVKYLTDKGERRDMVLFFVNKKPQEIVYREIFDAAVSIGLKTVYVITDEKSIPAGWQGRVGRITEDTIKQDVPDYLLRTFYLSGPHSMVDSYKHILKEMGISSSKIIVDYFPGYA